MERYNPLVGMVCASIPMFGVPVGNDVGAAERCATAHRFSWNPIGGRHPLCICGMVGCRSIVAEGMIGESFLTNRYLDGTIKV
jgi:hypothetical protein